MLLQHIMFFWALLALLVVILAAFEASPRALTMRFLQDVPHRYNLKSVAREPEQPAM